MSFLPFLAPLKLLLLSAGIKYSVCVIQRAAESCSIHMATLSWAWLHYLCGISEEHAKCHLLRWQLCKHVSRGHFVQKLGILGRPYRLGYRFVLSHALFSLQAVDLGWGFRLQGNCGQGTICCMVLALPLCSPPRKNKALNISLLCEFPFSNFSL